MIQELIHRQIVRHRAKVNDWFIEQSKDLAVPFYSSYDIRDAGYKVAPVDANIFPAGFNNICQVDRENAPPIAKAYLDQHYPNNSSQILLLAEEHTKNLYYWDNVKAIEDILEAAGRSVMIAIPRELDEPIELKSASGRPVRIHGAKRVGGGVEINGFKPQLIICNNDFSVENKDWIQGLETPMNPPHAMGWHRRRKDHFFSQYNQLAETFGRQIEVDPWLLQVRTELFSDFDINDEKSRHALAERVELFLEKTKASYKEHKVTQDPFVFIKNNAGTYGLGVIQARSGDDIRSWSYKDRKKMKATKGGGGVDEVIIQEGIPTTVSAQGETAEPAIYMVGCNLVGGFLRVHNLKGPDENLNSPGAVFKRLCVTDLKVNVEGCPMENVYGWLAKIALIAMAKEAAETGVEFNGFERPGICL